MRLLLLGGEGQVGTEFRALSLPGDVQLTAPRRSDLDLIDGAAVSRVIGEARWDVVVNAAAYTDVERAESEVERAFAINAGVPAQLAAETARRGIPLLHISTDYVFDGKKGAPYVEDDAVAPLNAYGRSKLAGERGMAANPRHIILRTSWLYSAHRNNFVKTILRLAAERDTLKVVADQCGCPTAARDVAAACLNIALRCAKRPEAAPFGIYHFAGGGEATWFEFAKAIVSFAAQRHSREPEILPIATSEYPTKAVRPADTRLDCSAIDRAFDIKPRPWRVALAETVAQLVGQRVEA